MRQITYYRKIKNNMPKTFQIFFLYVLIVIPFSGNSQTVSGKWKGYMVESDFRQFEKRYNVELEIEQLPMNIIKCTTTIYNKKRLVSTTSGQGYNNTKHNYIIFSEITFIIVNDSIDKEPCLMACQLTYNKIGRETLTGIFRSKKGSNYCSEGKVYLRRYIPQEERVKKREERKEKRIERKTKRKSRKANL